MESSAITEVSKREVLEVSHWLWSMNFEDNKLSGSESRKEWVVGYSVVDQDVYVVNRARELWVVHGRPEGIAPYWKMSDIGKSKGKILGKDVNYETFQNSQNQTLHRITYTNLDIGASVES